MRREADQLIRTLAEGRYGLFNRPEAFAAGHSKWTIQHRLEHGIWRIVLPETYALVGSPPSWRQSQMAACLWTRDGLAAGLSAGYLYGLPGCETPFVEVMTANHKVGSHSGVVVHHTNWLPAEQMTIVEAIPATSIERTLMSLCAQLSRRRAAIAVDHAITHGLTTIASLDRLLYLTARRGRDGCGTLRELIHERWDLAELPNSPLETVVFEMMMDGALPVPQLQVEIRDPYGRFIARPDFVYQEQRLIIEGHSRKWHEGFAATKRDIEKHERLTELGYRILYVTWPDATRYRRSTAQLILRMLSDPTFGSPRRSIEWDGSPLAEPRKNRPLLENFG